MPAVAIGALAVGSAVAGGIASSKAANGMKSNIDNGIAYEKQINDQNQALLKPWETAGGADMTRLNFLMGTGEDPTADQSLKGSLMHDFGLSDFQADPGYNFRLSEGEKAINRAAAARGDFYGGGTLKSLDRFNSDTASNEFQNAYNRYNTNREMKYSELMGPAQMGLNATEAGVNAAQHSADVVNSDFNARGQAAAAGSMGVGNAIQGGLKGIAGAITLDQMGVFNGNGATPPFVQTSSPGAQITPDMAPPQIAYPTASLPDLGAMMASSYSTPTPYVGSTLSNPMVSGAYMNPAIQNGTYFNVGDPSKSPLVALSKRGGGLG